MAPDLNSLPPSRSTTSSPPQSRSMVSSQSSSIRQETPSPRASMSLAAAATMNAADRSRRSSSSYQTRGSPQLGRLSSERRRSQVAINLSLNDPAIPGPGEMSTSERRSSIGHSFSAASPAVLGGRSAVATGDPHHHRQPSLGDIHNELEQEQEAQVNRMLQMIRAQQQQLEALQRTQQEGAQHSLPTQDPTSSTTTAAIIDESTPVSERSFSLSRPAALSRQSSSAVHSPALRPLPGHESQATNDYFLPSPHDSARRNSMRDDSAYYQAETASLTRENQMLRLRIRELEKQLSEMAAKPPNSPPTSSNLATSPPRDV